MHKREKSLNEFELQILHIDCLYLYIVVGTDLIIKSGKVGVSLNGLTTQHLFACFKPDPGFLTSCHGLFFCARWFQVRGDCLIC